jgi:hypothetical protein
MSRCNASSEDYRNIIEFDEPKTMKALSERKPIVMKSLDIEQNLVKDGNRRIV